MAWLPRLNDDELKEARGWLKECYPDDKDEIDEADATTITRVVHRDYDGGIDAFRINSVPQPRTD